MAKALLSVCNISKKFGKVQALAGVSFEVETGSVLVFRGASGSGKTTLLRILAGLDLPDQGKVFIDGALASGPGWALPPHRRGMGFIFQTPALWPHLTVAGNIMFGLGGLSRSQGRLRVKSLLEQVGLAGLEQRYPDQLSGGQIRRVALARTLAPNPACLLMDEPLVNLDEKLKIEMLELVAHMVAENGTTLIYVTHDATEVSKMGGRVLILEEGRLSPSE